jgi:DNA-binding protein
MAEDEKTESEATPETESEKVAEPKKVEAVKAAPRAERSPNTVFVGNKPPMNYVMAVITAFNMGDENTVTLKARGRAISTAVDVAEITRTRFFKDTKVHSISIGTEEIAPREGGNPRNVSTLEITLTK